MELRLHCCRCERTRTGVAVLFALLGIAWEVVAIANSCDHDVRKDLEAADDTLSYIPRFGRPAISLIGIRPRPKELPRRALLSQL